MSPSSRRPAPPGREPLSRDQVMAAALGVIDRDGPEGLSMRRLGAELGVEAMSLYHHVTGKADVLDGVVHLLWDEIDAGVADTSGSWQQQARMLGAAVRHTAHAHPRAYPLVLTRGVLPDGLGRVGDRLQQALVDVGFGTLARPAMLTLSAHATSQALAEVTWPGVRDDAANVPAAPATIGQELPLHDAHSPFALGLELLIEALAARLAQQPPLPR